MANTPGLSEKLFAIGSMLGADGNSVYQPTFRQQGSYRGSAPMPQPQQQGGGLGSALGAVGAAGVYGLLNRSQSTPDDTTLTVEAPAEMGAPAVPTALPSAQSMGFGQKPKSGLLSFF